MHLRVLARFYTEAPLADQNFGGLDPLWRCKGTRIKSTPGHFRHSDGSQPEQYLGTEGQCSVPPSVRSRSGPTNEPDVGDAS